MLLQSTQILLANIVFSCPHRSERQKQLRT